MWRELKRRNVVRVALAYVIAAWLVLQVTDTIIPILDLPSWITRAFLLLLAVGFIVALVLAWAFEITPEGVKREHEVDRSQSITNVTGRKLDFVIIGVLAIAVGYFALDKFYWHGYGFDSSVVVEPLEKSIAVLPFDNRSADDSDAYFVDGIHDDILTQLHKLSGIEKVISRTSVERYRDTSKSIPEIAAELSVDWILEGGVQRAGDTVRVNVQLIAAAADEHEWAEIYDRQLSTANVFEIQSEISIAIANSLHAALTVEEASELRGLPTKSLVAWEKYQLGKHAMRDDRSPERLRQARAYFEEAIEIDEDFALAHVGRADAIILGTTFGADTESDPVGSTWEDTVNALSEAQIAAKRALKINPRLGEAYTTLGYSHFQLLSREDMLQSDFYYRKAGELSPNYAQLYRWHAQTLWEYPLSQPVEALFMAERAVALDPMNSGNQTVLGWAYEMNGRVNEAQETIERALEISSTNVFSVRERIKYRQRHSEYSRAIVAGLDALRNFKDYPRILYEIARSYRQLGDRTKFEYWSYRVRQTDHYFYSRLVGAMIAMDEAHTDSAIMQYKEALEWWPDYWEIIHYIAYAYAQSGQSELLLDFIETHASEMLDRESPAVPPQGVMLVAVTAWALRETGKSAQSDALVELGREIGRNGPRHAYFGYGVEVSDVEMYAVQGMDRLALDALTRAIENGYRKPEWLERSPVLDPIRKKPEFVSAMNVIRADLSAQLAELQKMEQNGMLPPLPR